jgi:hypothetical protein
VFDLVLAFFCCYKIRNRRRSKIVMPRISRDFRENEPFGMAEFPSVSGDPFIEYRGEPEENLGAPERSPVDGREERSTADLLRSDAESIPELAIRNFGSDGRGDRD